MRKKSLVLMVLTLAICGAVLAPGPAGAQGQIHITVPLPPLPPLPPFVFPVPPPLFLVPDTSVYAVPDVDVDVVFYHGSWYRPHGDRWYRAGHYNGPWHLIARDKTPQSLRRLPPGFRRVPGEHRRHDYDDVRKNWKRWENDRRRDDRGRGGNDRGGGHDRGGHGGGKR
jgi:hypothetical protein